MKKLKNTNFKEIIYLPQWRLKTATAVAAVARNNTHTEWRSLQQEATKILNTSDGQLTSKVWVIFSSQRIVGWLWSALDASINHGGVIGRWRRDERTPTKHQPAAELLRLCDHDADARCHSSHRIQMLQLGQQHRQSFLCDLTAAGQIDLIKQSITQSFSRVAYRY